ncbi:2-aminoadipate transaminase [Oxobacter pfennigii]|uniref:2-aminoadipate transaminase n=1 Tax=Oxobacter pfennigii TaxID=36849 RepID=A0A0P8Y910_9CLOT|nr:PLP-dependent aminotransferase family protein [Oxobacter pfennigii]KPU43252.1 2-aminoadipate transaminase [Oxobacter pfennigii]
MEYKYARRISSIKASEIRELLKLTEKPEVISFAGGLPAPELFPIEEIKAANNYVLEHNGGQALQYSTTEGYQPLRKWIAERMNSQLGTSFCDENIMITHGSQQALDLSGKVFLDEGDAVLCESPTYLAAISAFKSYGCKFVEVETDGEGMIISELEKALKAFPASKIIYIIPNFQNPTGRTWSLERRQQVADISAKYNVIVIEDNPYGELRYEGDFLTSVKSFDRTGNIVCTGTFSKIFCPGYRIGWIAGDKDVIQKYVLVKQGVDLQCNTIAQMVIAAYLEKYDIDAHINKIREVYRRRRDVAIDAISRYFPPDTKYTKPEGGLFLWVELNDRINTVKLLERCLEHDVAFVPGNSFFPNTNKSNTLRINFSNTQEGKIADGIARIGNVLKEFK